MTRPYRGVFPVVPTAFTDSGELDLASQKRCVDFMIDAGAAGCMSGGGCPDGIRQMTC